MIVFLIAVALLVTHAQTGLTVSCIGAIVACLTLLVTVFTNGGAAMKEVLRGVDYKTLLFFIGLFISVAGLEQTGVLKLIAQFISNISGGSIKVVILIILLLSAVCSALESALPPSTGQRMSHSRRDTSLGGRGAVLPKQRAASRR